LDASDEPKEDNDKKLMVEDDLNNVKFHLSLFWKLESFANFGDDAIVSNTRLFEAFEEEIIRLPDGRYFTPIPWTTDK
jgi:hypothetical protein